MVNAITIFMKTQTMKIVWVFIILLTIFQIARTQPKYQVVRATDRDSAQYTYYGVSCSNENNCTVVGVAYNNRLPIPIKIIIERTTDGGKTWNFQDSKLPNQYADEEPKLRKVSCIDSSNIFIIGDSGIIMRTTNAGANWIRQNVNNTTDNFADISFSDVNNGIVTQSQGGAYTTSNGGNTWKQIVNLPINFYSTCRSFSENESSIYEYGFGPILHTTTNWSTFDSSVKVIPNYGTSTNYKIAPTVLFYNRNTVIAYGGHRTENNLGNSLNSYISLTTDRGAHWKEVFDSANIIWSGLRCLAMNGESFGVASGSGTNHPGILYTTNGGYNWEIDSVNIEIPFTDFYDAAFAGKNTVFFVAQQGFGGGIVKLNFPQLLHVESYEAIRYGTSVYPNPADQSFTLLSTQTSYEVQYSLYDLLGRKVMAIKTDSKKVQVNTRDLQNGIYKLVATSNGASIALSNIIVMH